MLHESGDLPRLHLIAKSKLTVLSIPVTSVRFFAKPLALHIAAVRHLDDRCFKCSSMWFRRRGWNIQCTIHSNLAALCWNFGVDYIKLVIATAANEVLYRLRQRWMDWIPKATVVVGSGLRLMLWTGLGLWSVLGIQSGNRSQTWVHTANSAIVTYTDWM